MSGGSRGVVVCKRQLESVTESIRVCRRERARTGECRARKRVRENERACEREGAREPEHVGVGKRERERETECVWGRESKRARTWQCRARKRAKERGVCVRECVCARECGKDRKKTACIVDVTKHTHAHTHTHTPYVTLYTGNLGL